MLTKQDIEQIRSDIRDVIENQQAVMEMADKKLIYHEDRIIDLKKSLA